MTRPAVFIEPPAGTGGGGGGAVDSVTGSGSAAASPTTGAVVIGVVTVDALPGSCATGDLVYLHTATDRGLYRGTAPDVWTPTGIQTKIRDLTTAEIATLNSSPITLVEAQGVGTVIVPTSAVFHLLPGTERFSQGSPLSIGFAADAAVLASGDASFAALDPLVLLFALPDTGPPGLEQASCENLPLRLSAPQEPGLTGPILTDSIAAAGTGYIIGEIITLTTVAGGTAAVVVVDSVDGGGEVLTYHRTANGTRHSVGDAPSQDSSTGVGVDFMLAVDTITPLTDGVGRFEGQWSLVALRS